MASQSGKAGTDQVRNPWVVLALLCLGFFMILLDTTIVNIAIPDIIDELDASLDEILWVINAYILAYAVLLITAGRLGDFLGPKRLFLIGLIVFTAASAACGLAQSPGQLIFFRVVQGVGGALLTPQTLSMLTIIFPPAKRGTAFGIWGAVAGVATIAGPTLGGWLVTYYSWRWIFYVNVPIGVITIVLSFLLMPDIQLNVRHRLDLLGTALATLGLFFICYGLIEGQPHAWGKVWGPITIPMIIVGGLVILGIFLWQQYLNRHKEPLVPFTIFKDRNYSLMNVVSAAISFGMLGLFLPLVIYLQSVLSLTALQAGLTLAPMSVVSLFVAPVAGRLSDKFGGKWILFIGLVLWTTGLSVLVASAHPDSNRWHLLPGLLIAGFGLGMTFAPLQTIAMLSIAPRLAGAASGMITTTRQLGAVIGSAAVGALLQAQLSQQLRTTATENAAALPEQFREEFVKSFSDTASRGLEVGAGQTGAALPSGLPAQVAKVVAEVAKRTFDQAFTAAMRSTLVLPLIVLGLSALIVLLVRRKPAEVRTGADHATPPAA